MHPFNNDNVNYWMVTTSEDIINDYNKSFFLRKEGSNYQLPYSKHNNFIGWYNTSDNKIYQPGDIIEVAHGMHFIAKYK